MEVDPTAAGPRAVISEGGGSGQPPCPLTPPFLRHVRTLWVSGVRANRTVLNASSVIGDLQVAATGYVSQHPVPWQVDAEDVELNYFHQLAPWQAQRCVLRPRCRAPPHCGAAMLRNNQPKCRRRVRAASQPEQRPEQRAFWLRRLRNDSDPSDPDCGLEGNPLGSGLPMFIENVPLADPDLLEGDGACPGAWFSFSPKS